MTLIKDVIQSKKWMGAMAPVSKPRLLCNVDCEVCGGIGYVRCDVPMDDPRFGKLIPCPNLPPESSIFEGHGLTARQLRESNWSSIDMRKDETDPNVTKAIAEAIAKLKGLLQRGGGLCYLYGGPGLAKTKLLQIFCAQWVRQGRGIFHLTTQKDILDQMRKAYDDDEPNRKIVEVQDKFIAYPLLAIDELTVERSTDFKVEQFFDTVNKRHEAGVERGEQFVTIMTGNIAPRDLDFRITDRLTDGRNFIVKLTGESYRPMMEWE